MKKYRLAVWAIAMAIIIGCGGCGVKMGSSGSEQQLALLGVKNTARVLGYSIANTRTKDDDVAIKGAYFLFRQGTMTPDLMTEALGSLKKMHPLAAAGCLDLLYAMGATVDIQQGAVLDVSGIPPEVWTAAADAYAVGYDLGVSDKAKGKRQQVVM